MRLRNIVGAAVLALGGLSAAAYADTLMMNDGREIRGRLVSVNRGIILFNQENGRQIRVNVNMVDDINLGNDSAYNRDNGYNNGRNSSDGRYNDGRSNDGRYNDGRYNDGRYSTPGNTTGNTTNTDRYGETSIAVYADRQWTDTGMTVRAGDVLRFTPSGEIVWGPGRRDGPAGEPNSPHNASRPIPDRPGAALIGRIGNDTFYIGEGTTSFRARTSGRLYLGINDDYLADNQGHFQVTVERSAQY
jgi:hypothetical protein